MPAKRNHESKFWKLLEKAERRILEKARAEHGTKAHEALQITQDVFLKRARKLGVSLKPLPGATPPKASSPSSSAARLASGPSVPSGRGSPPREAAPGGSLSWLMTAAKPK